MANTYSWVISQLDCYPEHEGLLEVIFTIHWRRQADDGLGHWADTYGLQEITVDPTGPFTAYADLTKEQVEGWLEDAIGTTRIAELDAILDQQIQAQINPPVIRPVLPWTVNNDPPPPLVDVPPEEPV
jgi:hypothetical protein